MSNQNEWNQWLQACLHDSIPGNFLLHPLLPTHITREQFENDLRCVMKAFLGCPFYFFFKWILAARVFVWFLSKRENMDHHMLWIQGMVCGNLDVTGSHNLQWADRRLCWSGYDRFGGTVSLSGWSLRFPMLGCCQCLNWLRIACKR